MSVTVEAGTCIGCGSCQAVCRAQAITMDWTARSEYVPVIDTAACTGCGRCHNVCPHSPTAVRAEARKVADAPDPWFFGLEDARCYLGWDLDPVRRRRSASGGVVTALLRRLFEKGAIDAVLHAEPVAGAVGEPHVRAAVSRSAEECDRRRSSFYHPITYGTALPSLLGTARRVAVVGVPCVIRAIKSVWAADDRYRSLGLVTIGLACSHNVNGQFTDFLAESVGIDPRLPFTASFRNKDRIPDANNFNVQFTAMGQAPVTVSRNLSLFTPAWRRHWFAMAACQVCADFWGSQADVSVKDAWGPWARDPLGRSIVAFRDPTLEGLLVSDSSLCLEPMDREVAMRSQQVTIKYKQLDVHDRIDSRPWSLANRQSGSLRFRVTAALSKECYAALGFRPTRVVLAPLMGKRDVPPFVRDEDRRLARLGKALRAVVRRGNAAIVACWGTGTMAFDVSRALAGRIDYFIDNDPARQGTSFCGRPVVGPAVLLDPPPEARIQVLIGSMHDDAIVRQIAAAGVGADVQVVPLRPLYELAALGWRQRLETAAATWRERVRRALAPTHQAAHRSRAPLRERKILVVGGYGFLNAGDEAQLASTIRALASRHPEHRIKVLTPSLKQTQDLHGCQVGEAPRQAFYDLDSSTLYALDSRWKKLAFLARATWLLGQAWLVGRGWPVVGLKARRAALLHDLATADLLVFCGGGYLTGRTLSRLWDGMFLIRMARSVRTPVVLSGQTIGVWDCAFSKRLAKWGLEQAAVIATRDADKSIQALEGLGLRRPRVMATCDDALCMDGADDAVGLAAAFRSAGFPEGMEHSPYVVLNAHYWGVPDADARRALVGQMTAILDRMRAEGAPAVVGVPMHQVDLDILDTLARARPDGWFRVLRCEGDFRIARSAIGGSRLCVSMKHHPVVFALGQGVPAISLALGDYYEHKNAGALGLLGQGACNVRLVEPDYLERFTALYRRLTTERGEASAAIRAELPRVARARAAFFDAVGEVLRAQP